MALFPIHKTYKLKKVIMSTYQAASGAGAEGMAELQTGMESVLKKETPANKIFAYPLPFNLIPHIDVFQSNLYTKEEMKVAWESRKIMSIPGLKISCTSVRIPTLRAHAESITIETEEKINAEDVRALLRSSPGVKVVDDPSNKVMTRLLSLLFPLLLFFFVPPSILLPPRLSHSFSLLSLSPPVRFSPNYKIVNILLKFLEVSHASHCYWRMGC